MSSRKVFSGKVSASSFVLSDAVHNTFATLKRGGIEDLRLLKRLFAICQKTREPTIRCINHVKSNPTLSFPNDQVKENAVKRTRNI